MAKKKTKKIEDSVIEVKEVKAEKPLSKEAKLAQESLGYFERFENITEIYATEEGQFFFKENDGKRNSSNGKVYTFKKNK